MPTRSVCVTNKQPITDIPCIINSRIIIFTAQIFQLIIFTRWIHQFIFLILNLVYYLDRAFGNKSYF